MGGRGERGLEPALCSSLHTCGRMQNKAEHVCVHVRVFVYVCVCVCACVCTCVCMCVWGVKK